MDVTDRIALVTGGGRGIGRGIVMALAENGADVVVSDVNLEDAKSVADEVAAAGRTAFALPLDVTDQASVDSAVEEAIRRFGRIDILVNNAGIIAAPGWEERDRSSDADWDMIYAINVRGMVRVTESASWSMKDRRYGKIINIASGAGRQGSADNPPYNVSKAGVISLTQATALELAPYNINANAICPGLLWTPMWGRIAARRVVQDDAMKGLSPRQAFERIVADRIPLGREQTPEDIGNLACFLASDFSKNITGQAINVNGGSRMD